MLFENLLKRLREPEKVLGLEVNPSLFPIPEMKQRLKDRAPLIDRVMAGPKIMLIGDEDGLRRLAQSCSSPPLAGRLQRFATDGKRAASVWGRKSAAV